VIVSTRAVDSFNKWGGWGELVLVSTSGGEEGDSLKFVLQFFRLFPPVSQLLTISTSQLLEMFYKVFAVKEM